MNISEVWKIVEGQIEKSYRDMTEWLCNKSLKIRGKLNSAAPLISKIRAEWGLDTLKVVLGENDSELANLIGEKEEIDKKFEKFKRENGEEFIEGLLEGLKYTVEKYEECLNSPLNIFFEDNVLEQGKENLPLLMLKYRDDIEILIAELDGKIDILEIKRRIQELDKILKKQVKEIAKRLKKIDYGPKIAPIFTPSTYWWWRVYESIN